MSPSADGDKGCAPLTAQTFEKVGSKLLIGVQQRPLSKKFLEFQEPFFKKVLGGVRGNAPIFITTSI